MATRTITTVTSSPSVTVYGQPVTFTAKVTAVPAGGTPTGTVTFTISGAGGGTYTRTLDANGTATVTTTSLVAGVHSATVQYHGSPQFLSSTGSYSHGVLRAETTTQATTSPDPSSPGEPVTLIATVRPVAPGAGIPTGTVIFVLPSRPAIYATLDANGVARVTLNDLATGTTPFEAIYRGDLNFLPSSGYGSHDVVRLETTTTVVSSPDPSVFGQPVTLTATVAAVSPGAGTPTGTVTFTVDGEGGGIFTATLDGSGTARVTISTLAPGGHAITASYGGDSRFEGSTGTDTQTVGPASTTTTLTASPSPAVHGQPVTFTATVRPVAPGAGTPTGNVTFTVEGAGVFTVPLGADGTASVTTGSLPAGDLTVKAAYGGDARFAASEETITYPVGKALTTTSVTSDPNPSVPGQTVTFTATVTPVPPGAGTPTGQVTFVIGSTTLSGTLVDGVATASTSSLAPGSYEVAATYGGDSDFSGSSGTETHTVTTASTTTTVSATPDPSLFGQTLTLQAVVSAVSPATGVPTGTVTFTIDGTSVTAPLGTAGVATATVDSPGAGQYTVTATYNGDANFAPSSGSGTQVVNRAATTTSVFSPPDPSVFGQTVTFTATVTPVSPGAGTPTGTVTFTDSLGDTFTVPLVSGVATVPRSDLPAGTYSLTATYDGDTNFEPSRGSDTHVVNPADTTTTVTSDPDPSVFGQTVTFTAAVEAAPPGAGTPTGQVTFTVDGTITLTGTLTGGTATATTNALPPGDHTITATYVGAGDNNYNPSTGTDTHTVNQAATSGTLTSSPSPAVFGEPVTLTFAVLAVPPGQGIPTGTVTFDISGPGGGTFTVPVDTTGKATLTLATLPAGPHTITATYSGDTDFTPVTRTETVTIGQAETTLTVTDAPDPSKLGDPVTIRATVSAVPPGSGTPTGQVTIVIDGSGGGTFTASLDANGTAELIISTLDLGPHTITATYNGDDNFTGSTGTTTHTVELEPSTTTTVTSTPDPSVFGQTVTFTATVTPGTAGPTPTGTVTFVITGGTGGGTFTQPLIGGTATLTLDTLNAATHTVTATYNGDTNYTPSTGADTHVVNPADTTTTVNSSPDPSVFGQVVTFTATVAAQPPGGGTPTGQVTFTIDGNTLTGTLTGGVATVTHATLPPGVHTITATYVGAGDNNYNPSTGTDAHTVTKANTTTAVTSSPDPSVFGQPVVFTATVTPEFAGTAPTGTVTFNFSGDGSYTAPVDTTGTATLTLATLPAANYTVTATYNGDDNFLSSSGTDTHTVNKAATRTTVSSTPDPTVFGQPVTFTAVVAPVAPGSGTPTGTVTFTIDTTTVSGTLIDGVATASISDSALPAGTYTVSATYGGDADFLPSTGNDTHTVNRAATSTVISSAPDPSVFGQPVTFTAVVTPIAPGAGIPTGTVTIVVSGDGTFTVPLDENGVATFTTSAAPAGTYSATGFYNGDANFAPSSGSGTQVVNRAATTTSVFSPPDPSVFGQTVTFTATVTPVSPGAGTPTGTVTFTDSLGDTFTVPLVSGIATVPRSDLPVGTYSLTATYNGDTNFAPSSGSDTHLVNPADTTTTVTSTPDPSVFGQTVTFTATVAAEPPGGGTPTGQVTFTFDGTTLTGTLTGGTATATTNALPPGDHTITATYVGAGDNNYNPSTGTDTHTVNQAATTTTVSSAPDPSVFGQPVVFTATVTPEFAGTAPTGTVTFNISGDGSYTVPVDTTGTATLTLATLPAGTYTVTTDYSGDTNYAPSSDSSTKTVNRAATALNVTSGPDPSKLGDPVTIRATVSAVPPGSGTPTGQVTIVIDGSGGGTFTASLDANGTAELTISTLDLGPHPITATYSGDDNFTGSTGTTPQTVELEPSTTTTVTSAPDPSVFGQTVTFTAVVTPGAAGPTPTGTVTFVITGGTGGGTFTQPLIGGTATLTLNTLNAATHTITATYNGDGSYDPSNDSDTHIVNPADTITTVTSDPDPSVFGQTVTFTATVAAQPPGGGTPTGQVTFTIDGSTTLTGTLTGGTATATTNALPPGDHTITATYVGAGDNNYNPSTGTDTHTVNQAATTTTVSSAPDPSVFGQPVVFTATVTPEFAGTAPTGTVTFNFSGDGSFTVPVDTTGTATLTLATLPAGTYTVTTDYNGDTNYAPSSGSSTKTVNKAVTTTAVTSSPDPSVFGESVLFTAIVAPVSPGGGTPTGQVTFTIPGGPTLVADLDAAGNASASTTALPAGSYTVTATYSGDANFLTSSGTDTHTVNRAPTHTVISSSPNPSVFGQEVVFTATVTPTSLGVGIPTGTVTIVVSGDGTFTVPLDENGVATFTTSAAPAGTYSATGFYNGDANFAPSSGSGTQVVNRAETVTTVSTSPDPTVFGEEITFTAVVTPVPPGAGIPTGTVTFIDSTGTFVRTVPLDPDGTATFVFPNTTFPPGVYSGTATYNGDTDFRPSTGADTHTVLPADTTTTVTSAPDPTRFGELVTFTATVAAQPPGGGTPTGQVTFTVDGTITLTGTLSGGTATATTNALPPGVHTIDATYVGAGDNNYNPSTGNDTHTVLLADTTTTVTSSPDPSVFGQPVTFTATVAPVAPGAGVPTGTVTFDISGGGTTTVPVDTTGTATLTLNSLPAGTSTINATYNGDTNYNSSTGNDTHAVNQADTTTTVTSGPDPSKLGDPVTIRATVSAVPPGSGTPTGDITFVITGSGGGTFTASLDANGTAELILSTLDLGLHTITATYDGDDDPNFTGSTGTTTQTVELEPSTTTTVTSAPDPSVFGQTVTFTATVTPGGVGPTPTGTVTFVVTGGTGGGTFTQPLIGGTATLTLNTLNAATHTVTATYNGDGSYDPSNDSDTHIVNPADTTTTVTSDPDPSVFGQTVTFTATVAAQPPGGGTPTGQVTFTIDGTTLTGTLTGGTATATTNALPPGVHTITATYVGAGDNNYNPSTGNDTHTVNQAATTTTVASTPDPSVFGQPVTITATVAPVAPGTGTPTGTVTFDISGSGTTTVPVDTTGTATLTLNSLPTGTSTITATYNGDTNFTGSTGTDTHTVNQTATATTVTSAPDPSFFGEAVTLTATVIALPPGGGTPAGTVTFLVDSGTHTGTLNESGVATVSVPNLPPGTYGITATYNGSPDHLSSTGTDTHTVNRAPTTTTVASSPDPSTFGQTVTFTASVASGIAGAGTPTGTVTFVIDGSITLTGTLSGGTASVTYSALGIGPHTVTATYSGSTNFAPSSGSDTHSVQGAATNTVVVSSPNPSVAGRLVTFTATVTPVPPATGTPTGTVTFNIDGGGGGIFTAPLVNGVAVITNRGLTIGPHLVTATYNGDGQFAPSTGTTTHTVTPA